MKDSKPRGRKKTPPNSLANYIVSAVINAVFLFLVNKIPDWNLAFIADTYPNVLWALNLSLIVQIAGNFLLVFYHPMVLHHVGNMLFSIAGFIALIVVYTVFPFHLPELRSGWLPTLVRIVMIVGMVGTGIATIVHLAGAIRSFLVRENR